MWSARYQGPRYGHTVCGYSLERPARILIAWDYGTHITSSKYEPIRPNDIHILYKTTEKSENQQIKIWMIKKWISPTRGAMFWLKGPLGGPPRPTLSIGALEKPSVSFWCRLTTLSLSVSAHFTTIGELHPCVNLFNIFIIIALYFSPKPIF